MSPLVSQNSMQVPQFLLLRQWISPANTAGRPTADAVDVPARRAEPAFPLATLSLALLIWLSMPLGESWAQPTANQPPQAATDVIRIHGSGTMQPLMEAWATEFSRRHPETRFELRPEGSLLAVAMLAEKTPAIGAMSRPLQDRELSELSGLGVNKVWQIPVARDQIALVSHPTCPLSSITTGQLKTIFGKSDSAPRWSQLLAGENAADRALVLVGPNELSGTRGAFVSHLFADADSLTTELVACDSPTQILERVAAEPQAIGFLSAAWLDDSANVLAVASAEDAPAQLPGVTHDDPNHQPYALERELMLVVAGSEDRQLTASERAFLEFALSEDGLLVAQRVRFLALPPERLAAARQQLAELLKQSK